MWAYVIFKECAQQWVEDESGKDFLEKEEFELGFKGAVS